MEIVIIFIGDSLVNDEKEVCILNVLIVLIKFYFRRNFKCDVKYVNRELVLKVFFVEVKKEKK